MPTIPPPPPPPPLPPSHPNKPNSKLPTRSNKQPLCPGPYRHNGGGSCDITTHPTIKRGRYCATHQTICLLCEWNPRHLIGEECRSCIGRERAAERAAREAAAAAVAASADREAEREADRATERARTTSATRTAAPRATRQRRGVNRRGGMRRKC